MEPVVRVWRPGGRYFADGCLAAAFVCLASNAFLPAVVPGWAIWCLLACSLLPRVVPALALHLLTTSVAGREHLVNSLSSHLVVVFLTSRERAAGWVDELAGVRDPVAIVPKIEDPLLPPSVLGVSVERTLPRQSAGWWVGWTEDGRVLAIEAGSWPRCVSAAVDRAFDSLSSDTALPSSPAVPPKGSAWEAPLVSFPRNRIEPDLPTAWHLFGKRLLSPAFLSQTLFLVLWVSEAVTTAPVGEKAMPFLVALVGEIFVLFKDVLVGARQEIVAAKQCRTAALRALERDGARAVRLGRLRPDGVWEEGMRRDEICFGDIVRFDLPESDLEERQCWNCPADMFLLTGRLSAEEQELTGEARPVMKEPLRSDMKGLLETAAARDDWVQGWTTPLAADWVSMVNPIARKSVLLAGSTLSMASSPPVANTTRRSKRIRSSYELPRAHGVCAVVIGTGRATQLGKALQAESGRSDQVSLSVVVDAWVPAMMCLVCLLFGASVAFSDVAVPVALFRLVRMLSQLFTPALTSGASLTVTLASEAIVAAGIECTEQSCILRLARVSTVTLDKTGTITEPRLILGGLVLPRAEWRDHPRLGSPELSFSTLAKLREGAVSDLVEAALVAMVGSGSYSVVFRQGNDSVPIPSITREDVDDTLLEGLGWQPGVVVPEDTALSDVIVRFRPQPSRGGSTPSGTPERSVWLSPSRSASRPRSLGPQAKAVGSDRVEGIEQLRAWPFVSFERRATAIVQIDRHGDSVFAVVVKGAPETVLELCKGATGAVERAEFLAASEAWAAAGNRVLAMAWRECTPQQAHDLSEDSSTAARRRAETGLVPLGLMVFSNPIKSDSVPVWQEMEAVGMRQCVVTGDSVLTAAKIVSKLRTCRTERAIVLGWESADRALVREVALENYSEDLPERSTSVAWERLSELVGPSVVVCCPGSVLRQLLEVEAKRHVLPLVDVVGRASPGDKGLFVTALKAVTQGGVMHVGDGANDVEAFRAADAGFSISPEQRDDETAPPSTVVAALAASKADFVTGRASLSSVTELLRMGVAASAAARFATELAVVAAVGNAARLMALYTRVGSIPMEVEWGSMLIDVILASIACVTTQLGVPKALPRNPHRWEFPLLAKQEWGKILLSGAFHFAMSSVALFLCARDSASLDHAFLAASLISGMGTLVLLAPGAPWQRNFLEQLHLGAALVAVVALCALGGAGYWVPFGTPPRWFIDEPQWGIFGVCLLTAAPLLVWQALVSLSVLFARVVVSELESS
jgi:magnesium-transporting ATPase (P-type)